MRRNELNIHRIQKFVVLDFLVRRTGDPFGLADVDAQGKKSSRVVLS